MQQPNNCRPFSVLPPSNPVVHTISGQLRNTYIGQTYHSCCPLYIYTTNTIAGNTAQKVKIHSQHNTHCSPSTTQQHNLHNTGVHMNGPTTYPNATRCILQHAATAHGAHLTYAMNLGSVQSSPAIGSIAICRAHAAHTVDRTPYSPPSTTSSRRKP